MGRSEREPRTVRLTLEYHGGRFAGWAKQPCRRTVQGELEAHLGLALGHPASVAVAGRTDAGVHAWRQVASFATAREVEPDRLARRLNAKLPADMSIAEAILARPGFDARRDAASRTYCYRVLRSPHRSPFEEGRALWWPQPIDIEALREAAGLVVGRHDFAAFTPTETHHVRFDRDVMACAWVEEPRGMILALLIEAESFLRHMVRVLVGTMIEVGMAQRSMEDFAALLDGAPRSFAGPTAKAHGLYLADVEYREE